MASRADFIQDREAGKDLVEQEGSRSRRAGEFLGRRGREPGSRRREGMTALTPTSAEVLTGIIFGIAGLMIMRKLMQMWGEW